MNDNRCAEDPDPLQPNRGGALFVPVRQGPMGYCARLFRTPLGIRTAVAFTDERQLTLTLGLRQTWIRLSEPAVRALVAPLGVVDLVVDPLLAAPGPAAASAARLAHRAARDPRVAGPLRATAAQSLSPASTS
ncbi:SAV_915 family protein [Streptomyces sp. NPDC060209]|uniref:SAV_915 family protein n=1 Tax=Streptomyces sp. NPDC060209 TaxID=3347073 RepID=UPI00366156D2